MAPAVNPDVPQFSTKIGLVSPFFVPRSSDTAPTATMTGPTGSHDLEVVAAGEHPEFGDRWQVNPPGPWWAEGDYEIVVSSGERYAVAVEPRRPKLTRDEVRRIAELPSDQVADVLAAFGPKNEVN